jgi:hypothetical protein
MATKLHIHSEQVVETAHFQVVRAFSGSDLHPPSRIAEGQNLDYDDLTIAVTANG